MKKSCKVAFLTTMLVLAPSLCRGQSKCPWIDEATVHRILGAAVTVNINFKNADYRVCEFSRQEGQVRRQLSVVISVMTDIPKQFSTYVKQCGPEAKPLPAIGDEAIFCSVQTHANLYTERVIGRVGNRAFNVSVGSSVKDDPSMSQKIRREDAQFAAEQIVRKLKWEVSGYAYNPFYAKHNCS
jgi:hypothetical protein